MHITDQIRAVQRLHQRHNTASFTSVKDLLSAYVDDLMENQLSQFIPVATYLNDGHPKYSGQATHNIPFGEVPRSEFEHAIARTVGFISWVDMEQNGGIFNPDFELAVDYFINGKKQKLNNLLENQPELVFACSPYGHQAGIIHYVAAHGIEIWRQQIPDNLTEMTELLLEKGALPRQANRILGGKKDFRSIVETSPLLNRVGFKQDITEMLF